MNEVVDRIEKVLLDAARRRAARRHRRMLLLTVALGLLVLVSGASAVTGVGPLGDGLTSNEKLPLGAKPAPGGESVTLAAENADGRRQEVRAYRRKSDQRGRLHDLPGAYHYCVASYTADRRGRLGPNGAICTLSTAFALKLAKRRLWLQCTGAGGVVVPRPAPPDPVCGLTLADTSEVRIEPNRGEAGDVLLSEPFSLRVNHQPAIVRREGLDPERARRLPVVLRVRAILGIVNAPATQPGAHTPRVKVTAVGPGGHEVSAHVGGSRLPMRTDLPSFDATPQPGGPTASLSSGPAGRRWTAKAWRTATNDHCASSTPAFGGAPRDPSIFCAWAPELGRFRSLVLGGALAMATRTHPRGPGQPHSHAVYGLVRADAARVRVRDAGGRTWVAELSRPWTTIRRRPGDLEPIPPRFRRRFAALPRAVKVRVFQVAVPGPAAPGRTVIATTRPNGKVVEARAARTPSKATSGLVVPRGPSP